MSLLDGMERMNRIPVNNEEFCKVKEGKSQTEQLIKSTRDESFKTKDLIGELTDKLKPILRDLPACPVNEINKKDLENKRMLITPLYDVLEDQNIIIQDINILLNDLIERIEI